MGGTLAGPKEHLPLNLYKARLVNVRSLNYRTDSVAIPIFPRTYQSKSNKRDKCSMATIYQNNSHYFLLRFPIYF